jgi:hypothetical protein
MGVEFVYCRDMGAGCFTFFIHKFVGIHITVSLSSKSFSKVGCCFSGCLIPDVLKLHSAFNFRVKQPQKIGCIFRHG